MIRPLRPCDEKCSGYDAEGAPCLQCWRGEVLAPSPEYAKNVSRCLACWHPAIPGRRICQICLDAVWLDEMHEREREKDRR